MAGQNTIANAWVQLMPSFQGGQNAIAQQMNGPLDRAGRDGGRRFGAGMTGAIGGLAAKMFAPLAAAAAGIGLTSILGDAINQASDLNEAGTKLAAIFGEEGTAAVEKFAAAGAKALGQNKLAVLDASATFGTFGKAAGLAGEDLADFSTGFVGLSTDLASFYNTSPEEAIQAIGAALRGEAEPIRKYGVLMDDASLRQEALALGLIKTTKEALTPQQKVLAAQALIYKQTADAQGDFARTSGGLANQQRILSAQFTDLKGRIGTALLPTITKFVTFLNANLVPGIEKAGQFLKPFAAAIKGIYDILIKGDFTGGFSAFGIEEDSELIGYLFGFRDTLISIGGYLRDLWRDGKAAADILVTGLKPVWDQLVAVWNSDLKPAFQELSAVLRDELGPLFGKAADEQGPMLKNLAEMTVSLVKFLLPSMVRGIQMFAAFVRGVAAVVGPLKDAYVWSINLATQVRLLVVQVQLFVSRSVAAVQNLAATFRQKFLEVRLTVAGAMAAVVATVRGLPGQITGAVGNLGNLLRQKGRDLIQGLISGITDRIAAIRSTMAKVAQTIGDFLPGSPVKEGPLKKWNNGMAGKRLVGMLADGLGDTSRVDQAMRGLSSSIATPRLSGSVGVAGSSGGADIAAAMRGMSWSVQLDRQGLLHIVNDGLGDMAERSVYA